MRPAIWALLGSHSYRFYTGAEVQETPRRLNLSWHACIGKAKKDFHTAKHMSATAEGAPYDHLGPPMATPSKYDMLCLPLTHCCLSPAAEFLALCETSCYIGPQELQRRLVMRYIIGQPWQSSVSPMTQ